MAICLLKWDDLIKVEYYLHDRLTWSKPLAVFDPHITTVAGKTSSNGLSFVNSSDNTYADIVAMIDEMSGSIVVDGTNSVSGTKMKTTLEYDMYYGDNDAKRIEWKRQLVELQQRSYDMRLTYMSGAVHIVRTIDTAWSVSYKESKGKIHVTVSVENISGAQRVFD